MKKEKLIISLLSLVILCSVVLGILTGCNTSDNGNLNGTTWESTAVYVDGERSDPEELLSTMLPYDADTTTSSDTADDAEILYRITFEKDFAIFQISQGETQIYTASLAYSSNDDTLSIPGLEAYAKVEDDTLTLSWVQNDDNSIVFRQT